MIQQNPIRFLHTVYAFVSLGLLFTMRDCMFSLSINRTVDFTLVIFSNLIDQLCWLILILAIYKFYYHVSKVIKWSVMKFLSYISLLTGLALVHSIIVVVGGKFLEHQLGIISSDSYIRIQKYFSGIIIRGTVNDFIYISIIILIYYFIQANKNVQKEQKQNAIISKELIEQQLATLRMQIHPHFLFNSLNTISALMEESVVNAQNMISKLASFLRYSLEFQEQKYVCLEDEVTFTKTYLEIEAERFIDRFNFSISISEESKKAKIPSFILQPFIENAIKHGLNKHSSVTEIIIKTMVLDNNVYLLIRNNGNKNKEVINEGIGLKNVRRRLNTLYNDRFNIEILQTEHFIINIKLPLTYE